jgi:hypothetical protein
MISSRIRRALVPGWRRLLAIGIGVPLILGLTLASAVAVSWLTGSEYQPPEELDAGMVADYAVGEPRLFEEEDVWVVRLEEEFLALYDRGVESGCPLQWRPEFAFMDRAGWFVDACTGAAYDLSGRCFSAGCRERLLSRRSVSVTTDGNVIVNLRELERDPRPEDLNR